MPKAVATARQAAERVAPFLFAGERIVCERVYFDSANILRQLGLIPDLSAAAH